MERSLKFTTKRGLEATLPAWTPSAGLADKKMNENSPIYNNPFHVPLMPPERWRKVGASGMCSLSMQVQRSEGLKPARRT
ncbi:MAG: hypothetical protein GX244_03185 [Firmicutes bacterium]|nr:hypothetical protein [Bacillota bacterium]